MRVSKSLSYHWLRCLTDLEFNHVKLLSTLEVLLDQFVRKLLEKCFRLGSCGTHKNNYADSANGCDKLGVLTDKRVKFVTYLFLWCHSNKALVEKEAFYLAITLTNGSTILIKNSFHVTLVQFK